jgi:hypothetical protein
MSPTNPAPPFEVRGALGFIGYVLAGYMAEAHLRTAD